MSKRRTKQERQAAAKKRRRQVKQALNQTKKDRAKKAGDATRRRGQNSGKESVYSQSVLMKADRQKKTFQQVFGYDIKLVKQDLIKTAAVSVVVGLILGILTTIN